MKRQKVWGRRNHAHAKGLQAEDPRMEKVKHACLRGVRDVQTPPAPFLGGGR